MKNNNSCPKCQGTKIMRIPGEAVNKNVANVIMTGMFSSVPVDRYICESCGFAEEWVTLESDLDKLRQKFDRI